jgi:hypothetical protein
LTPTSGQHTVDPITITFQVRSVIDLILPASARRGLFSSITDNAQWVADSDDRSTTNLRSFESGGAYLPHLSFFSFLHWRCRPPETPRAPRHQCGEG